MRFWKVMPESILCTFRAPNARHGYKRIMSDNSTGRITDEDFVSRFLPNSCMSYHGTKSHQEVLYFPVTNQTETDDEAGVSS